jgi:hypothetical protein
MSLFAFNLKFGQRTFLWLFVICFKQDISKHQLKYHFTFLIVFNLKRNVSDRSELCWLDLSKTGEMNSKRLLLSAELSIQVQMIYHSVIFEFKICVFNQKVEWYYLDLNISLWFLLRRWEYELKIIIYLLSNVFNFLSKHYIQSSNFNNIPQLFDSKNIDFEINI